jgi:hypothetical protein
VNWLDPWWHAADERPDLAAAYERELAAELGAGHPLFGVPLAAVGKHDGSDDVLFQVLDGSGRVAVVHLTWARHPEPPPWPGFEFFPNLEAFAEERMRRDNTAFAPE